MHSDNDASGDERKRTSDQDALEPSIPAVGERLEVFWPADNAYYPGVVTDINADDKHVILYDDAEVETLTISDEQWRYDTSEQAHFGRFSTLLSDEQHVLRQMMDVLGNKRILRYRTQGLDPVSTFQCVSCRRN